MSSTTLFFIILSGILALLLALFQYWYKSKKKTNIYKLLAFLRFATFFSLLLLLINPKIENVSYYTEKPKLIVAADNSNSIAYLKEDKTVNGIISNIKNNKTLNDKFDLSLFSFDADLNISDSLSFNVKQTNIANGLIKLKDIFKGNIAPTILITDGNQTYGNDYEYTSSNYNQQIFPVVIGDTTSFLDVKLQQLNVNKYAFYRNKFPIEAIITYDGSEDIITTFKILREDNIVYSQQINFNEERNSKVLNFALPANQIGLFSYKAVIEPIESEKNISNNFRNFAIEVVNEKSNIAIVSDFLHPDLGALKASIESNEQRSVSILGIDDFISKISDYQMVIIYQPNFKFKPVFQAIKEIPINKFVITGTKTDWNFINSENLGYEHDINNQYENYQAVLNNNYSEFLIPDLDFNSFPPLKGNFGNINFSVSNNIILFKQIGNISTDKMLLSTFEQNTKREALLLGENIWQWRAQSYLNNESFNLFDEFINKIVQYLASNNKRQRLNIDFDSFYNGGSDIIISAQYFNKTFEFDNRESIEIRVEDIASGDVKTFPFILKNNYYEVDLSSLAAADYNFTVSTKNSNISRTGKFKIIAYNIEEQFLNANEDKLAAIASNSNGQLYFPDKIENLINNLINDTRYAKIEKSTKNTVPLIDWKYLLALIVLSLTIEWFIRKYNGLI